LKIKVSEDSVSNTFQDSDGKSSSIPYIEIVKLAVVKRSENAKTFLGNGISEESIIIR